MKCESNQLNVKALEDFWGNTERFTLPIEENSVKNCHELPHDWTRNHAI